MSQFESIAAEYGAPVLLEHQGEQIVYTPRGGSPKTIKAIVIRDGLRTRNTDRGSRAEYELEIKIARGDVPSVVVNGDKVTLRKREEDSGTTTMTVSHLIDQVGGMWHLGLD